MALQSRVADRMPLFNGRANIADAVFGAIAGLTTTHSVTNPRATVDGDTAELFALVEDQHASRATPKRRLLLKNRYQVTLVRSGLGWGDRVHEHRDRLVRRHPTVLFA